MRESRECTRIGAAKRHPACEIRSRWRASGTISVLTLVASRVARSAPLLHCPQRRVPARRVRAPRDAPHVAVPPGDARPPGRRGVEAWRHHDGRTRCPIPRPRSTGAPAARQYRRALQTLPGGTNSNFRAWGEDTVYVDRGKGGMRLGPGRQRVHRPAPGLRAGDPRPRRRPRRRLRQRADAPGRQLLAHERGRDPGDGARQGAQPVGRQGPDDRVGHRGHDARDAHRPGLHRAAPRS